MSTDRWECRNSCPLAAGLVVCAANCPDWPRAHAPAAHLQGNAWQTDTAPRGADCLARFALNGPRVSGQSPSHCLGVGTVATAALARCNPSGKAGPGHHGVLV